MNTNRMTMRSEKPNPALQMVFKTNTNRANDTNESEDSVAGGDINDKTDNLRQNNDANSSFIRQVFGS